MTGARTQELSEVDEIFRMPFAPMNAIVLCEAGSIWPRVSPRSLPDLDLAAAGQPSAAALHRYVARE